MPFYYFDIDTGDGLAPDHDGVDLPTRQDVRRAAMAVLPAMASDMVPNGDKEHLLVVVRDGDGHAVFEATLTIEASWVDEAA